MNDQPIELRALLTAQTVKANAAVSSWEESAEVVGQLMVEAGTIEPRYIEAMKRTVRELGPYMVIAPGIALLHARPEDGVKELSLGLITLTTPVEFGHSTNDPVDLVFALAAVNKDAHVSALQVLAGMLMDEAILAQMRSASDTASLVSVIQTYGGNAS